MSHINKTDDKPSQNWIGLTHVSAEDFSLVIICWNTNNVEKITSLLSNDKLHKKYIFSKFTNGLHCIFFCLPVYLMRWEQYLSLTDTQA